jgi:hypothetical protein
MKRFRGGSSFGSSLHVTGTRVLHITLPRCEGPRLFTASHSRHPPPLSSHDAHSGACEEPIFTSWLLLSAEQAGPSVFIHTWSSHRAGACTRCRRAERCREQFWSLLSIFTAAAAELVIIRACHGTHAVPERAAAAAAQVHRATMYTWPAHHWRACALC